MIGKSSVEWNGGMWMPGAGAQALPRKQQGHDAAAHRNLTIALYPAFLVVVVAQRAFRLAGGGQRPTTARHSIFQEAWVSASTASTFAFLG